ncbi:uncharacterized protein LOC130804161 [Amaranthus tricolor]|uniref:uncharacterized protein LOC130804161 n=1 Tax=Amaranthus tricolor TaxID=29722 RepID=UPI0025844493|nr:uncharacterized protein LOC130804161 [Amaranthus tricolor]
MENETAAVIEQILSENSDFGFNGDSYYYNSNNHSNSEWKTVSRRQRKQKGKFSDLPVNSSAGVDHRHRQVVEAQLAVLDQFKSFSGGDSVENGVVEHDDNADVVEAEKSKPKKVKKPKVSISQAADEIDADHLAAYLVDISVTYESQPDIQLMRFADFYGKAFGSVGSTQFPWLKILKESSVSEMVDIPLCHVPSAVYKTSMEWLNKQSVDALGSFVLWLWDDILADLPTHQGTVKGSKKVARLQQQSPPSKCQVVKFIVFAMVLRRKPDVLFNQLPILKEGQKYFGREKLYLTIWVITQACQGDLVVGLYMWIQVLLPMLSENAVTPQFRDLILQLVERILLMPKARQLLLNGVVRKGERLVPPAALFTLMKLSFPLASAKIKETDRFHAVYPILKEVALAGSSGGKALKQVSQQIFDLAINATKEGVYSLSEEAVDVAIWCLTENQECYKQWDRLYLDNIEGSVIILKKLFEGKKFLSTLESSPESNVEQVQTILQSFKKKTELALAGKEFEDQKRSLNEADKYCKSLLANFSKGWGKRAAVLSSIIAVTAAIAYTMLPDEPSYWQRLYQGL